MKLYRNAIILVIVLGILTGAYIIANNYIKNKNEAETNKKDTTYTKIFNFDSKLISEVSVEGKDGKFVFAKDGDNWKAITPKDFKFDKSKVDSIASNLSSLTADKVIEENATDLAQYGLGSPSTTASAKLTDGSVKILEIGNKTSTRDGYYVKEKDSNKVYTISSYVGDALVVGKNDLRDKSLLTIKSDEVTGFSLERGGSTVFKAKKLDKDNWALTYPIEANVNLSSLQPMIEAAASVTAVSFTEENPSDLGKYGLKNPSYSIEVEYAGGKAKILLGSEKTRGSEIYAKLADSNEVFTMDLKPYNFLDKPLTEIMETFAYIVNINDVSKVVVEMDGQTVTSEIQVDSGDDRDKDKFFVNGKDATVKDDKGNSLFRKYYQALIGVTLSSVEPEGKPEGKAEITFTYYLKKDPGIMKVEFIPKDKDYYYVVKNGKYSGIVVAKKKFDEPEGVREAYRNLIKAMENK